MPAPPFTEIDSIDDSRVADFRDLKDDVLRRERDLFAVEGRLSVEALVRHSRFAVNSVLVNRASREAMAETWQALPSATPCFEAGRDVLAGVVGFPFHRGCLALAQRRPEAGLDELLTAGEGAGSAPVLVALEDLTDIDNVGSSFRNALALGASGVLLSPRCCDPLYRKAVRTSLGAVLRLPYARAKAWPEDLRALRAAGYTIVALDPAVDAEPIGVVASRLRPQPGERLVVLVGTEGAGLSQEALQLADARARIPMAADVDSVNVATALALALHRLIEPRLGGARA